MSQQLFRGGLPYALGIAQLDEAFPADQLTEGRVLRHAEMSGVLGVDALTRRYYGVINSWRKRHKNSIGRILEWEHGEGLKVLNPAQKLGHVEIKTKQKIKQTIRAAAELKWVDGSRLDPVGQQRLAHQARVTRVMEDALRKSQKEMVIDLAPIKCLPFRKTGT